MKKRNPSTSSSSSRPLSATPPESVLHDYQSLLQTLYNIHDDHFAGSRLSEAVAHLSSTKLPMSLETAGSLLCAMKGRKRAETLLSLILRHHYLDPSGISHDSIEKLLVRSDLAKDAVVAEKFTEELKLYKRIGARPITTPIESMTRSEEKEVKKKSAKNTNIQVDYRPKRTITPEQDRPPMFCAPEIVEKIPYNVLCQRIAENNLLSLYVGHYEKHLEPEEFQTIFGCTENEFALLQPWKQLEMKRDRGLF